MELTPDDVRDVLRALDSSGLAELHLEVADWALTVRRDGAGGWTAEHTVLRDPVLDSGAGTAAPEPAAPASGAGVAEGLVAVRPPLLGTFYRAPQPGSPPFVEVGDRVAVDTVVGVVETMKMMTPVHAGVTGTVVEFRIGNGEFADKDAVLLVVDPVTGGGAGG